jgi:hypothetical protein
MAGTSLIKKASNALRAENKKQTLKKFTEKLDTERMMTSGGALAGALGAAFIDKKWGEDEEGGEVLIEPAKVKGVPVNLAVGVAGVVAAVAWKGMPLRSLLGGACLGQACAGVYRLGYDNMEFDAK